MKQFSMSKYEILWEYSWIELIMLMATFSQPGSGDKAAAEPELPAISPKEFYKMFKNGSKHKG